MMRGFRFALVALLFGSVAAQAAPGVLQANSANVRENDGSVTVTVQRRHGSTGVVTVDYATRSASAVAGRDFTPVSGTLTFQEGEVSKSVTIAILDNATYDGNRTFFLGLSNATGGATITTYPVGDVDLYDDEPPPNVSIDDIRVTEGNSGTTNAEFTITITGVTRSIDIRILWDTNSYSAEEDSDFQSSGGTFWFTPADTQKTISVPVFGDLSIEDDEKFNVYVYGGASFTKQYGYCTIVNDDVADGAPTLSVIFDPPFPTVLVGQTVSVRATVLPFEAPMTLPLAVLGGTAEVPAGVDVGADGGSFPITGLAPGAFAINVALPSRNGGGMAQLFGEVTEPPRLPTISYIAPASGSDAGGTNVTITGANFASNCTFAFGNAPAAKLVLANGTSANGTSAIATTPAHTAGAVDITVTCGSDTFTLTKAFTFSAGRRRAVR
jgi:hypothetical protein